MIWGSQSNIAMALVLVTALTQILAKLNKDLRIQKEKLVDTNAKLRSANIEINKNLEFIMSIYEWVDVIIAQQDSNSMKKMFVEYIKTITGAEKAVFITNVCSNYTRFEMALGDHKKMGPKQLKFILDKAHSFEAQEGPTIIREGEHAYILSIVKSDIKIHGLLCAQIKIDRQIGLPAINPETINKVKFLSKICAMGFSKIEMGELNEKLVEDRERNRIAEEIHDGVLQKLFGLSCYLYEASRKLNHDKNRVIKDEIQQVRASLNLATKELRETIYGMSTAKNGLDNFSSDLESYINEIKHIYNIDIKLLSCVDHSMLSVKQQKAFYRIISESISNSIRHGNATSIEVKLDSIHNSICLKIEDNGSGFNYEGLGEEKMGLGIRSMRHLIYSLDGNMEIRSSPGKGTKIIATVTRKEAS